MVSLTEVTFDWSCFCGFCCFVIPVSIYQNLDLKGDHEKPLIPKFALRSLIFFLLILCECQLWVQSSDILILFHAIWVGYLISFNCYTFSWCFSFGFGSCHGDSKRISYCQHLLPQNKLLTYFCVCNMFLVCFLKGRTLFACWKINKWYVAKDKVFVQSALKSFNIELTEIQYLLHPAIITIDHSTFSLVGSGKY